MNENNSFSAGADNQKNKKRKKKKVQLNIRNMGVNIDKNEYYEIVLSNSSRPQQSL